MAEVFEAGAVIAGAHENNYRERERGGLEQAARGLPDIPAQCRSFASLRMTIRKILSCRCKAFISVTGSYLCGLANWGGCGHTHGRRIRDEGGDGAEDHHDQADPNPGD